MGLPYDKVVDILYQLREMGTLVILLTGGEIFLRDDIMDIIRTARRMGFSVSLLSNASLLTEKIVEELERLHINSFSTTVFSLDKYINDRITTVAGSLDSILKNVDMLKKHGIRTEIKTPLMKDNKFEYRRLIPYCEENGYQYTPSTLITSKMNGDKSTTSLRLEDEDFKIVFHEIEKYLQKEKIYFEDFNVNNSPCPAIRYAISIDSKGDVYPCSSLCYKVGNIYEHDLEYIWNQSEGYKYLNNLKNSSLKECGKCYLQNYCTRCPGHALLEDGDLLGCSSIDKRHAMLLYHDTKKEE